MKRENTCYETNKLDTLKFIRICNYFTLVYEHKKMLLPELAKRIWKMIQKDVFNVPNSEIHFNELISAVDFNYFMMYMYDMCHIVEQNARDYYNYREFEDKDCISVIGEPI